MTEYINTTTLLKELDHAFHTDTIGKKDVINLIINLPAADVAPVRHGQWITEFDDLGWLKHTCTVCGYVKRTDVHVSLGWNYCPNCGAKMDGGEY